MELSGYVEALRAQLAASGGLGGPDTAALADRLADTLESATRLVLQQAVCEAAAQITYQLAPGGVDVRLRGRDLDFVVTVPDQHSGDVETTSPEPPVASTAHAPAGPDGSEAGTARITFRPPDHLKARIEEAAERAGLSVNAFLVSTLTAALDAPAARRSPTRGDQVTGWFV